MSGAASVPPPITDRGVEVTHKIDFLTCTTEKPLLDTVATLSKYLGADFVHQPFGYNGYQQHYVGVNGVQISFTPGRLDVCVNIPGQACTLLGTLNLVAITEELNAKATRLDFAFDHCKFTPRQLDKAWLKRNVNTRVRRLGDSYGYQRNGAFHETVYMGAASSESRLVCYNKRGYTRLEMRLRKKRAAKAWAMFCADPESIGKVSTGIVAAHADFVKRSETDSNISRAPRLRWWAKFIKDAEKIHLSDPEPEQTVERTVKHVNNQAAMFATYLEIKERQGVSREAALDALLTRGERRMRGRHRALVAMVPVQPETLIEPEPIQRSLFTVGEPVRQFHSGAR